MELLKLLSDRRVWAGPAAGVALLFLAANAAVEHWTDVLHSPVGARREEQGRYVEDLRAKGRPVRFDWSIGDQLETYEKAIPDARKTRLVIVCGMSQMYTVNGYKPGDQTVSEWMDDALAPRGARVFGLAAPNLSHEEALFMLLTTLRHPGTKPANFIFAVAFEKLREVDLRPRFQAYVARHPETAAAWRDIATRHRAEYPLATKKMLATLGQIQTKASPSEESLESRLRARIAKVMPVVRERKYLNSYARTSIINFRNFVFGISNTTKRPIVPELYDTNREFLGLLADVARENGVGLMLYIVPFNPSADNPYIPEEYAAFKKWMVAFTQQKQVPLANLENVVPPEDWGLFFGGPDFKHFKGEGHRKTAAALVQAFGDRLTAGGAR